MIIKHSTIWFCLPLVVILLFAVLCQLGLLWCFLPLLVLLNLLNSAMGEFGQEELPGLFRQYNECKKVLAIKYFSAVIFLLLNIWGVFYMASHPTGPAELALLVLSFGVINCTFTMAVGHELLHMEEQVPRVLANALLFTVCLPFFANDHLYGHHRHVGSSADASSARRGQHFYHYLATVVRHRWRSSFIAENRVRLAVVRRNYILAAVNIIAVIAMLAALPGWRQAALFFFAQALISYLMFELSNYVQHYGLSRKVLADGSHEPISMHHSWNYYCRYTNYLTFLVPLHSYHHVSRLPQGNAWPLGPRLPHSYFKMMLLALVPPLWFKKMNVLCEEYA